MNWFPISNFVDVEVGELKCDLHPGWIRYLKKLSEDRGKYSGITLGAYRNASALPWFPAGVIEVWTPCARSEVATEVSWPHCFFKQVVGNLSIFCEHCRSELLKSRRVIQVPTQPQLSLF